MHRTPKKLRDRIKEIRRVRGRDLVPCPENWRTHPGKQRRALKGAIAEVGIADRLLAWERPDGQLQLIDGHLRAEEHPDAEWTVLVLDVDEQEAAYLLATLDPLAALAGANATQLDAVLRQFNSGDAAVQELLGDIAAQAGLYLEDPPEATEPDTTPPTESAPEEPVVDIETTIAIGQYRFTVGRAEYQDWIDEVWQTAGFDKESVIAELRTRLGFE